MTASLLFDTWTSYGPGPAKDPQERWTLKHLLEDMDFCGIAGALVRHRQMPCYNSMHINARLLNEIKPHRDRLMPVWAVQPHQAGDFPEPLELRQQMDDEGIQAVYMQPARQGYPVHADVLQPLADVLNPRQTMILTTLAELGANYDTTIPFCRLFAHCPILLGEASWGQWRLVTAIMDACPNTYLEFHLFQANRAVECLAARYGAERLLFGSGLLKHSAGAARSFVDWSLLEPTQVEQFAGRNLQRLLGCRLSARQPSMLSTDPYVQAAAAGQPLPGPVLDAHCHVLDEGLDGAGAAYVMPQGDADNMLELTRKMGIQKTAMMSWNGTVSMDAEAGNALIERIVRKHSREVIGVSSCDPTHQTPEQIEALCRHLHLELGFRGMKPYHTSNLSYASPLYEPYWRFGNDHRLYALLHTAAGAGGLNAVEAVAERYPDLTILIAHSGGSWVFARQVADVAQRHANVMAELTLTPVPNGIIEWLCEEIGTERVLFGTDAPMRDPRPQLGWCVYTRLPIADKKRILGENFTRILGRSTLPTSKGL